MTTSRNNKNIICLGEVLWDIFPTARKIGGAPLNVAYHLKNLGIESSLISRVGRDEMGTRLLKILEEWGILTSFCQLDSLYPTSEVQTKKGEQGEVSFEILYPVAWDFIEWKNEFEQLSIEADALVFGSLVTRNEVSYKTLLQMMELSKYNVFDVNLRSPYFSKEIIENLLQRTNLLKLNESELEIICDLQKSNLQNEVEKIKSLQSDFEIEEIILTKGNRGATYYLGDARFDCSSYSVVVEDTVGSGDAFLGAFLANKFREPTNIESQLKYASALGGFVATKEGACPDYNLKDLDQFIQNHKLHN